jgi:hypothetical protein
MDIDGAFVYCKSTKQGVLMLDHLHRSEGVPSPEQLHEMNARVVAYIGASVVAGESTDSAINEGGAGPPGAAHQPDKGKLAVLNRQLVPDNSDYL